MIKIQFGIILGLITIVLFSECRKRDSLPLQDNFVAFESAAQGISSSESSITVKLNLLNTTSTDLPLLINVTELGLTYSAQYSTTPAAVAGKISLIVPAGSNKVSFTLNKIPNAIFDGNEKLIFDILSAGSSVSIGVTKQFILNFAELVSTTSTATINGGGANFGNKVFVDISTTRQNAILRTNWDLSFYTGTDDFRVKLNSSMNMMAKQLNKIDLNSVSSADTIGFTNEVAFSPFAPTAISLPYIDYPNGDLTRTAIAAISTTASDNRVYIVNRGSVIGTSGASRGWKKIRIIRNGSNGYTIQYADIAATTFTSTDIPKDENSFYKDFSFENGITTIEPTKKKWDFAWTYFANTTNFGTGEVPYMFQDVVLLNRNVQAAKVLVSSKPFVDFAEADLNTQTFLSTQNAIATDWRSGGGPGTAPSVRTDRYYIIRDTDNNYYKLRFTALTQNNERGYPSYEAILIKRG